MAAYQLAMESEHEDAASTAGVRLSFLLGNYDEL